jgi:hypothetical protein
VFCQRLRGAAFQTINDFIRFLWWGEALSRKWFLAINGVRHGPVPEADIPSLLLDGSVSGSTPVWNGELEDWIELRQSDLAALLKSIPPALPPQLKAEHPTKSLLDKTGKGNFDGWSQSARPLGGLYRWFVFSILAYIISALVSAFSLMMLSSAIAEDSGQQADAAKSTFGLLINSGAVASLSFIVTTVIYFLFVYRATKNLHASHAAGVTISPAWVVIWHFIPIANYWMPFQAMREIWKGSHDPRRAKKRTPGSMIAWWAFRILAAAFTFFSVRALIEGGSAANRGVFASGLFLQSLSILAHIGSAFFLADVVQRITKAQDVGISKDIL